MIDRSNKMPLIFVGHGSPMNAIEDNKFTQGWERIASIIPRPEAILTISAHWFTDGTRITDSEQPNMIYDMYGFPDELYQVDYPAKGAPELANLTKDLITKDVKIDNSWGLDHGAWSVLYKMYPKADIPVIQLSVDGRADVESHYKIGQEIRSLRDKGVLILASGNVVHNLSRVNFDMEDGYPWAIEFDQYIKEKIISKKFEDVINYKNVGNAAALAAPTPDHFYPLLYILGASDTDDKVTVFNDHAVAGSLSMTSYLFQ